MERTRSSGEGGESRKFPRDERAEVNVVAPNRRVVANFRTRYGRRARTVGGEGTLFVHMFFAPLVLSLGTRRAYVAIACAPRVARGTKWRRATS